MSSQFTVLINRVTKKVLVLDNWKVRYNRMRARISDWVKTLDPTSRDDYQFVMLTLTYAPEYQWQPNHIREFMLSMKKLLGDNLLGYAWVAELQKRGAIHYHLLLYVPKALQIGSDIPYPDTVGLWKWGLTRVEVARTPFYLITYLGKEYQKNFAGFPKGCRAFAVFVKDDVLKKLLRYKSLRAFAQSIVDNFGWSELASMLKLRNRLMSEDGYTGWELWRFTSTKDDAIEQGQGWKELGYEWRGEDYFNQVSQ